MKRENFYRRDPGLALQGMSSMSLEERGVYNTVIDLLYLTWRPLEDDPGYIAGHCRCAVQKLNPILRRLIESEKLVRFIENGRSYISNPTFERERNDVKGPSKTRSGRAGVEEKSREVEEKSASVSMNPALLHTSVQTIQPVTALDRVDESRQEAIASSVVDATPKGEVEQAVEIWNGVAARCGLPMAKGATNKRRVSIRARLKEAGLDGWREACVAVERSKTCRGLTDIGFKADLDFVSTPSKFQRLREGFYGADAPVSASTLAADAPQFAGPADLLARIKALTDDDFVTAYIGPAGWEGATRSIVARTNYGADQIRKRLDGYLTEKKITVTVAGQPASTIPHTPGLEPERQHQEAAA